MFIIDDIYDEGKKIVGACDDLRFYRLCADVVGMIASKMDTEMAKLTLDICTTGCNCSGNHSADCGSHCITLPSEVQTVIACNIGGRPTLGVGESYSFHLNGLGDCNQSCEFMWQDLGRHYCTYKDLITPAQLVVHLQGAEDNGKLFIVQGFDKDGNKLRREECNQWLDGIRLPTIAGYPIADSAAPYVSRITNILKDETVGTMRLATQDSDGQSGVNLGVYLPDERIPSFRRIKLNRACSWVRVLCIKTNPTFRSRFDHVPLQSRLAFLLGMQARKAYSALQLAEAHQFEADAARLELEQQMKLEAPLYAPIQIIDRAGSLRDKNDYDIV